MGRGLRTLFADFAPSHVFNINSRRGFIVFQHSPYITGSGKDQVVMIYHASR